MRYVYRHSNYQISNVLLTNKLCAESVLDQYWISIGSVFDKYWISIGSVLDQYRSVLDQYWISIGSVLDQYWIIFNKFTLPFNYFKCSC